MFEKNPKLRNSNRLPGDKYAEESIMNANISRNIQQISRRVYCGQEKLLHEKKEQKSLGTVSLSIRQRTTLELQRNSEFRTWSRKILFFGRVGGCMVFGPMYRPLPSWISRKQQSMTSKSSKTSWTSRTYFVIIIIKDTRNIFYRHVAPRLTAKIRGHLIHHRHHHHYQIWVCNTGIQMTEYRTAPLLLALFLYLSLLNSELNGVHL
jgi:hypothetical protein